MPGLNGAPMVHHRHPVGLTTIKPHMEQELSFGQKAVGLSFNPGNNPQVEEIKQAFAKVIDIINDMKPAYDGKPNEVARMCAIAITESQTAQMWAVKAATWKD